MQNQSPAWVDRLFARLAVRYGSAWMRMWEGIPMEAVKADWCSELAHIFERNPKAIAHALNHLPEFPPNVERFRSLCQGAPDYFVALPAPVAKPDVERLAKAMSEINKPSRHVTPAAACAARLRAILERGGKLSGPQRDMLASCESMGAAA